LYKELYLLFQDEFLNAQDYQRVEEIEPEEMENTVSNSNEVKPMNMLKTFLSAHSTNIIFDLFEKV
jgi:hypothetical protein